MKTENQTSQPQWITDRPPTISDGGNGFVATPYSGSINGWEIQSIGFVQRKGVPWMSQRSAKAYTDLNPAPSPWPKKPPGTPWIKDSPPTADDACDRLVAVPSNFGKKWKAEYHYSVKNRGTPWMVKDFAEDNYTEDNPAPSPWTEGEKTDDVEPDNETVFLTKAFKSPKKTMKIKIQEPPRTEKFPLARKRSENGAWYVFTHTHKCFIVSKELGNHFGKVDNSCRFNNDEILDLEAEPPEFVRLLLEEHHGPEPMTLEREFGPEEYKGKRLFDIVSDMLGVDELELKEGTEITITL